MIQIVNRQIIRNRLLSAKLAKSDLEEYFSTKYAEMGINPIKLEATDIQEQIREYESFFASALRTEAVEAVSSYSNTDN
jgi:hypothetical protein